MARIRNGEVADAPGVYIGDAYADDILEVLSADPRAEDGYARSQWVWLRLPNGDLFLAVAPQDETYLATEEGHTA
jgi:hypothetical protein